MIRLFRIEARHSVVPVLIPLLVVLTCLSPIARHLRPVALWPDRSTDLQSLVQLYGPFTAAAAAWTACRERRCGLEDLLRTTSVSPWRRVTAGWAAITAWSLLCYAATAAIFFAITARQATWGGPVWWPVYVGLTAVLACSGVGLTAGRWLPGRFTSALTAVSVFAAMAGAASVAFDRVSVYGLLGPLHPGIDLQSSVFFPVRADVARVQLVFLFGVLALALGATAVQVRDRSSRHLAGGPGSTLATVGLLVAGLSLTGTGIELISTTHFTGEEIVVAALHDPATDYPLAFTPDCSTAPLPVCVHPAYSAELTTLSATVNAVAAPLAGDPGLPVRAEQDPTPHSLSLVDSAGRTVLTLPPFIIQGTTISPPPFAQELRTAIALGLVTAPGTPAAQATPVQRVLARFLLDQVHTSPYPRLLPADDAQQAAAHRLAVLTPGARARWLQADIAAVRAGRLDIEDIP